jgi:hypothetical protein
MTTGLDVGGRRAIPGRDQDVVAGNKPTAWSSTPTVWILAHVVVLGAHDASPTAAAV